MDTIGFDHIHAYLQQNPDRIRRHLSTYFGPYVAPTARGQNDQGYTGRYFEYYAARSDPWRISGDDIAAATTLSVTFDRHLVASLAQAAGELEGLLALAPHPTVPIWEVPRSTFDDDSPLSRLYSRLRGIFQIGPAFASKLLAAKRPDLIPIRDDLVWRIMGEPERWWCLWHDLLYGSAGAGLRGLTVELSKDLVPEPVSLLRRLDVVLWMEANDPSDP